MKTILLTSLLCLAPIALQAHSNESLKQQCMEEFESNHLEKALYFCHGSAPDPEAEYILGKIYSHEGIYSPEMNKAFEYFLASANQNHPEAQFMVALCYQNGLGVTLDRSKAALWYEQAREHGFMAPPLSKSFRLQERVDVSDWPGAEELERAISGMKSKQADAIEWLTKAAEKGNVAAQYQLGLYSLAGNNLPQDDAKAIYWFSQAAQKNHQDAQGYLAWMSMLGLGKEANPTEAIQWYLKACQKQNTLSAEDIDPLEDLVNSLSSNQNYFDKRSPESEYLQAIDLISARLSDQDLKDGLVLLEKASDEDYSPAQFYLAKLYHDGHLVKQNVPLAIRFYQSAANLGHPEAQYALGWIYFYGDGVPQNNTTAFEWFSKASASEERAKQAMQFIQAQEPSIILGDYKIKEPVKVKMQKATRYLKSLFPSKKQSS